MCLSYCGITNIRGSLFPWIKGNSGKILLALFTILISTLVAIWLHGPDFALSVEEPLLSYSMAGDRFVHITLESTNPLRSYNNRIGLIAIERGRVEMPEGISAHFLGDEGPTVSLHSEKQIKELKINIAEAKEASRLIDVVAFGKDGIERKCSFYLHYIEPPN